MNTATTLLSTFALLLTTGCLQPSIDTSSNYKGDSATKTLTFTTNEHNFMHSLSKASTVEERNSYMDEFLLKSDMQCANYLNQPLQKTDDTAKNDSLYMNIAEGVSSLFGLGYITSTAKAVFLEGNDEASAEEKTAYANALSPEMRKGVEIARARFAKEMRKKEALPLEKYSIKNLKEDTLKYDKQCNLEYGLIEINRALREMQSQMNTRAVPKEPTATLDPQVIKDKVAQATQEVKEKKEEKKREEAESSKQIETPTSDNNETAILSI